VRDEGEFPHHASQTVAGGGFVQQVQRAMNLEPAKKIPQERSPNQFFQNQLLVVSDCDPQKEKGRSGLSQPDQIENKDPNLQAHSLNYTRVKTANQSNSQAHLIKLIQEQKENKNKIRFCSVGKAQNSNANIFQSHGKPVPQSRTIQNEAGKTAPLKNFRQIQKIHKSMQKKERSAGEFQMQ
jgi:hypothetical protein